MIYTKQEWYTPAEVAIHNQVNDCWISLNGKVFDMSPWIEDQFRLCKCTKKCSCKYKNWFCDDTCRESCGCCKKGFSYCDARRLAMTIVVYAGKDVSHWFKGDEWVRYMHPVTALGTTYMLHGHGLRQPVVPSTKWRPLEKPCCRLQQAKADMMFNCSPHQLAMTIVAYAGKDVSHWFKGDEWVRYMHPVTTLGTTYMLHGHGLRQPVVPSTKWRPLEKPWWLNDGFVVGKATAKTRPIRITNTLTGSTVTLEVCSEETIYQIMMRYLPYNSHMHSYSWRYLGRGLCYNKTLAENGIPDERDRFSSVALPENTHIPAILVYYNDDLTEDPHRDDCYCFERSCVTHQSRMCKMRDWLDSTDNN